MVSLLELQCDMGSLFVPLIRMLRFQSEGRFRRARKEAAQAADRIAAAKATIDKIEAYELLDEDAIISTRSQVDCLGKMMAATGEVCVAEELGYRGRIDQYLDRLRTVSERYREAADVIPPSEDPQCLMLKQFCNRFADTLETRAENFEVKLGPLAERFLHPDGKKVFIIHGHDEGRWRELRDLLREEFSLESVVLKEEVSGGRTIIKKFEDHANECGYAIALFTSDDFVTQDGETILQARPNVIFELGWFFGRFGRDRACILASQDTKIPSDLDGVVRLEFREHVSERFVDLRGELERAEMIPRRSDTQ